MHKSELTYSCDQSTRQPPRQRKRRVLVASLVVWLVLVSIGLGSLAGYEASPGVQAAPPVQWPSGSLIQPTPQQATLVVLAHPHCPCTRATIGELAAIMAHSQGRLSAYVLFIKPPGAPGDWAVTDLWQSAARIPGVKVLEDSDGSEARRFNSATSGQALLYDPQGHLLFSGGITASRGHSGDNAGRDAIVSLVNANPADRNQTPVFGCPLFDPGSECRVSKDESSKH
jgi:hypothetical protein